MLYGPGWAVHGPDVFGGAINIVTRVARGEAETTADRIFGNGNGIGIVR